MKSNQGVLYWQIKKMGFLSPAQLDRYWRDGFLIVRKWASSVDILNLRQAMERFVKDCDPAGTPIFTTERELGNPESYFLESGDQIRCFYEEKAFGTAGKLLVSKELAVNKVGHALHDLHPVFKNFSYRQELLDIALSIGMEQPSIVQSQYIFKQPHIGAKVNPHIDSTFLYTEPPSCFGAWVALEEATTENGCLTAIPGSHREYSIRERFVSNETRTETRFIKIGPGRPAWDTARLQPLEVEAGDLILLHGQLVHASMANCSERSRHAYIMHLVDLSCHWLPDNWLQRPADFPFRPMAQVVKYADED